MKISVKLVIIAFILGFALLSGCTQPGDPVDDANNDLVELETCGEQNGFICTAEEECTGTNITAKDSVSCCSVECSLVVVPEENKLLEEMNLTIDDFSAEFIQEDGNFGYELDALEYSNGDQNHADELIAEGWQENYSIEFSKYLDVNGELDMNTLLEGYYVALSRYEESETLATYFSDVMNDYNYSIWDATPVERTFGDNTFFGRVDGDWGEPNPEMVSYVLFFTKSNFWVTIYAQGQPAELTDEKVIALAEIVENRIQ